MPRSVVDTTSRPRSEPAPYRRIGTRRRQLFHDSCGAHINDSGACLVPNDQQIMSPDVRLNIAPHFTCVNGGLFTLFADNLTTYSPRGTFGVAVCYGSCTS